MSDFEEKLNAILSNPDAMAQVASLAQSLGAGAPSPSQDSGTAAGETAQAEPPPSQTGSDPAAPDLGNLSSLLGQIDPSVIGRLLPLMRELNGPQDNQRRQFL